MCCVFLHLLPHNDSCWRIKSYPCERDGIIMKRRLFCLILILALLLSTITGCGVKSTQKDASAAASPSPAAESPANVSAAPLAMAITELYQSQPLMLEMLVSESCMIAEENDILVVTTPQGRAVVAVSFIPGIQNLGATAELIPAILQETYGAQVSAVTDGNLFGARAERCTYSYTAKDGTQTQGLFAASVVNQSLYMLDASFKTGCTDEEAALIINVFSSMNVLQPKAVDTSSKTAEYESRYPNVKPANAAQKTYIPVSDWYYLPYYYYAWNSDTDWTVYDPYFYEPDWDYYDDGTWWSWGRDDSSDWGFYDEYSDWYDEAYYDAYYDYHSDYDPWSDPGDNNDEWSDPGDYGYYYEEDWSDPGDYYEEDGMGDYFEDGMGDYFE